MLLSNIFHITQYLRGETMWGRDKEKAEEEENGSSSSNLRDTNKRFKYDFPFTVSF